MDRRHFIQLGFVAALASALGLPRRALAYSTELITVPRILGWGPCEDYPEAVFAPWIGAGKTPYEMTTLPATWEATQPLCNAKAMLWVLLRTDIFTKVELKLLFIRALEASVPNTQANRTLLTALRRYVAGTTDLATIKTTLDGHRFDDAWAAVDFYFDSRIDFDDVRAYLWEQKAGRLRYTVACCIAFRPVEDTVRLVLGNLTDVQRSALLALAGRVLNGSVDLTPDLGAK